MEKRRKDKREEVTKLLTLQKIRDVKELESYKLSVCHPHSAGIDLGSKEIYVALDPRIAAEMSLPIVHVFNTFTSGLLSCRDLLCSCGITTVAMESTSVYWTTIYSILKSSGLEVCLVNPKKFRMVPGRKTDVLDCQWLQTLHLYGLITGSFHPEEKIAELRSYMRERGRIIKDRGRERIWMDKNTFGDVVYRPVDKRENYVKRCIGMPGDTIEIRDNQVYIDGKAAENPENMQFCYYVETDGSPITEEQFRLMNVSKEDRILVSNNGYYQDLMSFLGFESIAPGQYNPVYRMPLTKKALAIAEKLPIVKKIVIEPDAFSGLTYPAWYETGWTRDNYGPLWIPKKGATIPLNERNIALYGRCIKNYENNTLEEKDGTYYINGKPETDYTFKYDYYWMMGDNRHNSADSRSWGFVPEDHIVGKPILIWLSLDKDRSLFDGGIRWNRLFRMVHPN